MITQTVRSCPLSDRDVRRYLRRNAAPTNGAATDRATSDAAQQNGKCERFGFLQPWFVEAHRRMTALVDLLERQLDAAADEVHFGRRGVAAPLPHSPLRGEAPLLACRARTES